jgi:hypothetical protein
LISIWNFLCFSGCENNNNTHWKTLLISCLLLRNKQKK